MSLIDRKQSFSALKKIDCARAPAPAKFLQDLALTVALKTFWAPLIFALILKLWKVGYLQESNYLFSVSRQLSGIQLSGAQ